jgi:hypothetical protein
MGQSALAFEDALTEPFLYHDVTRSGFVSFVTPKAKQRQASFRLAELPSRIEAAQGQADIYITQHEFFKPNRRLVNCKRLTSFYLDLDTYNDPELPKHPQALLELVLLACERALVPEPSVPGWPPKIPHLWPPQTPPPELIGRGL